MGRKPTWAVSINIIFNGVEYPVRRNMRRTLPQALTTAVTHLRRGAPSVDVVRGKQAFRLVRR